MDTIDVSTKVLAEMVRIAGSVPTNKTCSCKKVVTGMLPNNKPKSWIYGVVIPHYRVVCGIHENACYIPHEEMLFFCEECGKSIFKKIPNLLNSKDPKEPTKGGHFITVCWLNKKGGTDCFSRFQSGLEGFKKIMSILKNE